MNKKFYKIARPDGWDFYTGKTINYRENIGKIVRCPVTGIPELCSATAIHASRNPNQCFIGGRIPCSVYQVGGKPIVEDMDKCGFSELKIIAELNPIKVFKWKYEEACNPIHPFRIKPPKIEREHTQLLKKWASVRDSVRDSVRAYMGYIFSPCIKKWKYIDHKEGVYPFQAAVDLWKMGLVSSYDGKKWRLHGGERADILWESKDE